MRIMAVCGSGLGSSFMLEMNIKKVLKDLGEVAEVNHTDLSSVTQGMADIFVMAQDISDSCPNLQNKIILANVVDKKALKDKLTLKLEEMK